RRPDLGRQLNEPSIDLLQSAGIARNQDVAIILADGLSATAINNHAIPFLKLLIPSLSDSGISLAPITLVEHGRVAIGDEIGELWKAKLSVILIGERPGLSSPDSMGVYFTYRPTVGLTDDSRNCVSNIRPAGLPYQAAAEKLFYLIKESLRLKLSGVNLKDSASLPGEQVTTA
ncbi:MAG: ethanolamine ammonia-lyase, partial [Bacteroidia bacterium]|nr:ethanolamine ammonia-lyase [Bacteroidia bacterium]